MEGPHVKAGRRHSYIRADPGRGSCSRSEDAPVAATPLQAADQAQPVQGGESFPQQVAPDEDGHPFIGIVVHTLGHEAAQDLGITGGVRVTRVLPEGPSADILHRGDVISISILRDGQTSDLTVTVGDRSEYDDVLWPDPPKRPRAVTKRVIVRRPHPPQLSGRLGGILPRLRALEDRFVRGELVSRDRRRLQDLHRRQGHPLRH